MSDEIENKIEHQSARESFETAAAESPTKRKFWSRNKIIALGAAVVLLGGGGVWAYAAYQSPTTVVGMAIGSIFSEQNPAFDVSINASGNALGDNTVDVDLQVSSADVGSDLKAALNLGLSGQPAKANVELIATKKGDYFFQLSEFDSLLSLLSATGLNDAQISSIGETVSNKWVKLSKTEIDLLTGPSGQAAGCLQTKYEDKAHAQLVSSQVLDLAKSHQVMVVTKTLGSKNGSLGFQMGIDAKQLKLFLTGLIDSEAFADVQECVTTLGPITADKESAKAEIAKIDEANVGDALKNLKIEIWADQWSHKLTNLSLASSQNGFDMNFSLKPVANRGAKVIVPTENVVTVSDIQSALMLATIGAL